MRHGIGLVDEDFYSFTPGQNTVDVLHHDILATPDDPVNTAGSKALGSLLTRCSCPTLLASGDL